MYIEFDLKKVWLPAVLVAVEDWAEQYHISYKIKQNKSKAKLTFVNDEHYAFFCLTWNATQYNFSIPFVLIEPGKIDKVK